MKRILAALALMAAIAAEPAASATLLGLVDTGELYSSVNGGVTWTPLATLPVRDAVALAARLTSTDLFMASASGGV